jgi:hypothetical protein
MRSSRSSRLRTQPMKFYRSVTIQDSSLPNEKNNQSKINDRATSTIDMCTSEW